jgi:hypothetical protein
VTTSCSIQGAIHQNFSARDNSNGSRTRFSKLMRLSAFHNAIPPHLGAHARNRTVFCCLQDSRIAINASRANLLGHKEGFEPSSHPYQGCILATELFVPTKTSCSTSTAATLDRRHPSSAIHDGWCVPMLASACEVASCRSHQASGQPSSDCRECSTLPSSPSYSGHHATGA